MHTSLVKVKPGCSLAKFRNAQSSTCFVHYYTRDCASTLVRLREADKLSRCVTLSLEVVKYGGKKVQYIQSLCWPSNVQRATHSHTCQNPPKHTHIHTHTHTHVFIHSLWNSLSWLCAFCSFRFSHMCQACKHKTNIH